MSVSITVILPEYCENQGEKSTAVWTSPYLSTEQSSTQNHRSATTSTANTTHEGNTSTDIPVQTGTTTITDETSFTTRGSVRTPVSTEASSRTSTDIPVPTNITTKGDGSSFRTRSLGRTTPVSSTRVNLTRWTTTNSSSTSPAIIQSSVAPVITLTHIEGGVSTAVIAVVTCVGFVAITVLILILVMVYRRHRAAMKRQQAGYHVHSLDGNPSGRHDLECVNRSYNNYVDPDIKDPYSVMGELDQSEKSGVSTVSSVHSVYYSKGHVDFFFQGELEPPGQDFMQATDDDYAVENLSYSE